MILFSRMKESPSLRKLGRNRAAMFAMGVISLYMLLFVWITGMQIVGWVGNQTGVFDISERPILGALLTERTSEQVGAKEQPGFGLVSSPEQRIEQVKFYFDRAGRIFTELEQQENSVGESRELVDVLESTRLAERRVADIEINELQAIYTEGVDLFAQQDTLRFLRAIVPKIQIAVEKVDGYQQQIDELESSATVDTDKQEILYDDLAITLDELVELVGEYVDIIGEDDPLVSIDTSPLVDAVDALFNLEPLDPIYDSGVVEQISQGLDGANDRIENAVNKKLEQIEPVLAKLYPIPSGVEGMVYKFRMMLGTDKQGRSILLRALYSAKIAIQVGLIVSFFAVFFGSLIGAAAGYFGGAVDHLVIWLYSTFSSIPYLVLLVVLSFMFTGSSIERTLIPLYVAFSLTFWIGPCRVTRGEALKLRSLDYVQAAQALGASKTRILLKHILPNTSHLMFINSSLLFIGAIKGEVVLTYLGLGLKDGVSWGNMISQSGSQITAGFFWQIGAATFFMFVLVLAFNVLTDALQDAFDPKHVG